MNQTNTKPTSLIALFFVKKMLKTLNFTKEKNKLIYIVCTIFFFLSNFSYAQIEPFDSMTEDKLEILKKERCHSTLREYEHYKTLSKEKKAAYKKNSEDYELQLRSIAKQLQSGKRRAIASTLIIPLNPDTDPVYTTIPEYTIPVIFHVVHDGDDDYVLTKEQVNRAIKRVNEDFNGLSESKNTIQDQFKADESRVGVRFVLAQKDPEGNPTDGVTYGVHFNTFTTSQGGFAARRRDIKWPTNKYLNIWVINRNSTYDFVDGDSEQGGSGYAWLPQHDNGLTDNGSSTGITMAYWVLADKVENNEGLFPFRHILTHEIGHWLGLNHSWGSGYNSGDSAACNADDGIADTPNTVGRQRKAGVSHCDYTFSSCGVETNVHDFMNYTPCTSMFTNGQKAAMIASLNSDMAGRNNVVSDTNLTETLYVQNPETPRLVYSSDLGNGKRKFREERVSNTGVIATKTTIHIINGSFPNNLIGQYLVENTHFTTTNTPDGLQAKINIIDANKAEFSFNGSATNHTARTVTDFKLSFKDAAFNNLVASAIDNTSDVVFSIQFRNPDDNAPYKFLVGEGTLYNNSDNQEFGFYQRLRFPLGYGNSILSFKFSNNNLYVRSNTESGASGFVIDNDGNSAGEDEITVLNYGDILNQQSNWSVFNRDLKNTKPAKNWKKVISQDAADIDNFLDKDLYIGTYLMYDGQIFYRWISFTIFKTEHGNLGLKLLDSAFPNTPNTEIACGKLSNQTTPVNYLNTGYPFLYESIKNNGELHKKSFQFILRGENSFKNNITADDYNIGTKNDKDELVNILPAGISIASIETLDNGKRLRFNLTGILTDHDTEVATEISLNKSAYTDIDDTENGITNPRKFTFLTVNKKLAGNAEIKRVDKDNTFLSLRGGNIKFEFKTDFTKVTPETKIVVHSNSGGTSVKFGSQFIPDDANSNNVKILEEGVLLDENAGFTFPRSVNGSDEIIIHNKDYTKWENKTGYIGYFYSVGRFRYYAWIKVKVGENGKYLEVLGDSVYTLTHTPISTGQFRDDITEYCEASNPSDRIYIKKVQLGNINNDSGHLPYSDYSALSAELVKGNEYTLTINTHNEHWTYNGVGVWIDWNNNFYFDDEGEQVFKKYAAGPYTTTIKVPDNVNPSQVRMRVRLTYGSEDYILPCGDSGDSSGRGEVEDYTIIISAPPALTWTGAIDTDWNNTGNWDLNSTPPLNADITIPSGLTNYPTASSAVTFNSMIINSGATFIPQNTVTGTITYRRNIPTTNWHLVSSPIANETLQSIITNNVFATGAGGNIGIGSYTNNGITPWTYSNSTSANNIISGVGLSVKLAASGDLAFTGNALNTSNVTYDISTGTRNNFNLIGNPFTAYINSATFATTNKDVLSEETIWLWNGTNYITKNKVDPIELAPGQAFFVEASTNSTVNFTTDNRAHQNSDTFLKQAPKPTFELFVENGNIKKSTKVFYVANKTTSFDNGYDSKMFMGSTSNFELFTELLTNNEGKKLAIQTLPNSNMENMIIPVGIISKEGKEVSFSVNTKNLPSEMNVYLEDRINDVFTNLSKGNHTVTLNNDANGTGQFFIHTSTKRPDTIDSSLENLTIYKSSNSELTITGLQTEKASLTVFSILGKKVITKEITSSNGKDKVILPKIAAGVYIVELTSELGKTSKKIILE